MTDTFLTYRPSLLRRMAQNVKDRFKPKDMRNPPIQLVAYVGGDFEKVGCEFRQHLIDLCNLKPSHRVLDVGCGVGRIAVPLTDYLKASEGGGYCGFDVIYPLIRWCQRAITPQFPNFRFDHADVLNDFYNPVGRTKSSEYRFPYPDKSFDAVILTSVFTHMFPADLEHYLSEISRTMKPGGMSLITWFILNDGSRAGVESGKSSQKFAHQVGECLTTDPVHPEAALAYEEPRVRELYAKCGMSIVGDIKFGSWSGREGFSYQDIVIARKN